MPTVRRYGTPQVARAPLPGVRRSAALTPAAAGAGVAAAREQTAATIAQSAGHFARYGLDTFARIREEEKARADDFAIMRAANDLKSWQSQRLYDPEAGALATRGEAALTLPETVASEYDEQASTLAAGLGNDEQRAAFQRIVLQDRVNLELDLRRHVFGEINRLTADELKATVSNATSAAVAHAGDPDRVAEELALGEQAIQRVLPRQGAGPEQIEAAVAAFRSDVHVGVIERLITNDQADDAEFYLEAHRSQISGQVIEGVERKLAEGTLREQAQVETERILREFDTLEAQREAAKQIDSPRVSDEVLSRIEHEDAVRQRVERDAHDDLVRGVYDTLDGGAGVDQIDATVWSELDPGERASARAYSAAVARGEPIETNWRRYYDLMTLAGTDPATFATQDLYRYRHELNEVEFKQLVSMKTGLLAGQSGDVAETIDGFRTTSQVINDSLWQYGLDPTAEENQNAVAQLRRMVDVRVQAFEGEAGRPISSTDVQTVVDDLLSMNIHVPGSWWNILPFGASFSDRTVPWRELTYGDIPTEHREGIEASLRSRGRLISETVVLNLYLENLARQAGRPRVTSGGGG